MSQAGRRAAIGLLLSGLASTAWSYTSPAKVESYLDRFRGYSTLTSRAGSTPDAYGVNITTWQMSHGGFSKAKDSSYLHTWDGSSELSSWTGVGGTPLGMFDNNATVMEIQFLSNLYKTTSNASTKAKVKASVRKAVDFVIASQRGTGAWPQVHPKRGNYSDQATYNDNAMVRVMVLVKDILARKAPFDSDILDSATVHPKLRTALKNSVTYALKAQIVNNGAPTVWCAQHDTATYAPVGARSYELASKSGAESAGIVAFLMSWGDQTADVQKAVKGALAWYKKTRVADMKFSSGAFTTSAGASMWYRFYEVANDAYFFCDRAGESTKTQDITKLTEDRRTGYQWAGDYGTALLALESHYLSALGSTSVRSRDASRLLSTRRSGSDLLVRVDGDGIWQARWVLADGTTLSESRLAARGGTLEVAAPSASGRSMGFLVLVDPQGRSETLPAPLVR